MYLTNQRYFTNCLAWTSHAGIIWTLFTSFETDFKHCKYIFNDWVSGWINIVTCVDDCTTLSVKLSNNYFTFLRRFVLYPDQMFRNQSTFKNSNYDLLRLMHTNKIANTSILPLFTWSDWYAIHRTCQVSSVCMVGQGHYQFEFDSRIGHSYILPEKFIHLCILTIRIILYGRSNCKYVLRHDYCG